ncbi:MAG: hypothetical protein K9W42_06345 [Candidatus Heimdallarchaeota archaeon]|nr:hypothetical protein [Candidatus Heimdallarchaeota archaeon]
MAFLPNSIAINKIASVKAEEQLPNVTPPTHSQESANGNNSDQEFSLQSDNITETSGGYKTIGYFTQDSFVDLDKDGYSLEWERYDDLGPVSDYIYVRFRQYNTSSEPEIFWHPLDTYGKLRSYNLINNEHINSTIFTPVFSADTYIQGKVFFMVLGDVWPSAYNYWYLRITLERFNPSNKQTTYIGSIEDYFDDGQRKYELTLANTTFIPAGYRLKITYEVMLPWSSYFPGRDNNIELRTGYYGYDSTWTINDANSTYNNVYNLEDDIESFGMQLFMYQDSYPTITVSGLTNNTVYSSPQNGTIIVSSDAVQSRYRWDSDSFTNFTSPQTISVPETTGWHTLTVEAYDYFDNLATLKYRIGYDSTPVNVILHSPSNNSLVTDGQLLNFSVNDSSLTTYEWDKDGDQHLLSAPYDIPLKEGFNGIHQLTINVTDVFGSYLYEYFFEFDNNPPEVTLDNVVNGSTLAQGKNIDIRINDRSTPLIVKYRWDSDSNSTWEPISGNLYRTFLPITEGWHNLTVFANDSFGLTTVKFYTFNTSLTILNVELVNMINNSYYLGGNTIEIKIVYDNGTIKYFWGNDPWKDGTTVDNILTLSGADALSSTPGTYCLTVIVGDVLHQQHTYRFVFTVDQEAPTVSQTNPIPDYNGSRFLTSAVLSYVIKDNLTAVSDLYIVFSIDGAENQTFVTQFDIYLDGLVDGEHNLTIYVEDIAGNYYLYYITFIIDTTRPGMSVSIPGLAMTPDEKRYIPANAVVNVNIWDADPIVNSYYSWNYSAYQSFSDSFTLPAIEGYARLLIKANDSLGNTRYRSYWLTIDATSPTISLFFIKNNSKINAETPLRFIIQDISDDTVDYVESQWDLEASPAVRSTDFNVSLLAAHLSKDEATINLLARDIVGNEYSCIYYFLLDFEAPTYQLIGTANNSYVRGGFLLNFTVTSSDLRAFYYRWDNSTEYQNSPAPWDIAVPILDGNHTLYIRLEDDTGAGVYVNFVEAKFVFIVDDMELIYITPSDFSDEYYYTMNYGENFTFSVNIRDAINKTAIPGLLVKYIHENSEINLTIILNQPNATVYEFTIIAFDVTNRSFSSIEFQFYQFAGNRQSVIVHFKVHKQEGILLILDAPTSVIYEENITITFQLRDNMNKTAQELFIIRVEGLTQAITTTLIDPLKFIYSVSFRSHSFFTGKGNTTFSLEVESQNYFGVRNSSNALPIEILPIPTILTVEVNALEIIFDTELVVTVTFTRVDATPIAFADITVTFTIYFKNGTIQEVNRTTQTDTSGKATINYRIVKGMEEITVKATFAGSNKYDPLQEVFGSEILAVSGGLSLQMILIIIAAAVLLSIVMGFVIYRLVRARPFEELMEKVSEEEIEENTLKMSPGVLLSIFDQTKGPIPLVGNYSLEDPYYKPRMRIGVENFLLKICDQAYSSLGFEEHDERRRIGSINLPNEDMVAFIHGIQLENKLMRGGFENLSLIVLADAAFGGFLLANQEFLYPEIDELITALKEKKPLAEIEVLLDAIRRRSVIIMVAASKNAKKDKKELQKYK